jgi:hypothetical protein
MMYLCSYDMIMLFLILDSEFVFFIFLCRYSFHFDDLIIYKVGMEGELCRADYRTLGKTIIMSFF